MARKIEPQKDHMETDRVDEGVHCPSLGCDWFRRPEIMPRHRHVVGQLRLPSLPLGRLSLNKSKDFKSAAMTFIDTP